MLVDHRYNQTIGNWSIGEISDYINHPNSPRVYIFFPSVSQNIRHIKMVQMRFTDFNETDILLFFIYFYDICFDDKSDRSSSWTWHAIALNSYLRLTEINFDASVWNIIEYLFDVLNGLVRWNMRIGIHKINLLLNVNFLYFFIRVWIKRLLISSPSHTYIHSPSLSISVRW
jgi:hypothetical protein